MHSEHDPGLLRSLHCRVHCVRLSDILHVFSVSRELSAPPTDSYTAPFKKLYSTTVDSAAAGRTRSHAERVHAGRTEVQETSTHTHALARRNLLVAMGAAVCAPVATEVVLPPAARAATLRDMTSGEQAAFTAAMERLFNEGFDTPRPDRFVCCYSFQCMHAVSCCSVLATREICCLYPRTRNRMFTHLRMHV